MERRAFLCGSAVGFAGMVSGAAPSMPRARHEAERGPVVMTSEGIVRGLVDNRVAVFKGLRYGAFTGGLARFRRARRPSSWRGIRDFWEFGESAPQYDGSNPQIGLPKPDADLWASFSAPKAQGEDCLRLNIWTPSIEPGARRPVLVWIHGGGFREGSGSINATDGSALAAARDVVVVTLNHRLGVFGFLSLDHLGQSYADSGNVGMLDIVDALKWIRQNIHQFGGDPNRVTLFGESGGGAKVSALLAMPEARGLFAGAICQSGVLIWGNERASAQEASDALLDQLQIDRRNLEAISAIPSSRLLEGVEALGPKFARRFIPTIGGSLPAHPFADGAPQVSSDVPIIIGTSRNEATNLVGSTSMFGLTWEALCQVLGKMFTTDIAGVVSAYRHHYPQHSPSDIFFAVMSEFLIIRGARYVADIRARQASAPTWVYSLEWPTPVANGKFGVPHGLSVPLVFGTIALVPSMLPLNNESLALSELMGELWSNFARFGSPTSPQISWPKYTTSGRETLALDMPPIMSSNVRGAEYEFLSELPWFDTNGDHREPPRGVALR